MRRTEVNTRRAPTSSPGSDSQFVATPPPRGTPEFLRDQSHPEAKAEVVLRGFVNGQHRDVDCFSAANRIEREINGYYQIKGEQ